MTEVTVSMPLESYLALVSLARVGATTPDKSRALENFLKDIEKTLPIKRYALYVQWQELMSNLPPSANFPAVWPPEMRILIEQTGTPITKKNVMDAVAKKAKSPTNILVTKDVGGLVGWTKVDDFFVT
jgi:hypothetical protein